MEWYAKYMHVIVSIPLYVTHVMPLPSFSSAKHGIRSKYISIKLSIENITMSYNQSVKVPLTFSPSSAVVFSMSA